MGGDGGGRSGYERSTPNESAIHIEFEQLNRQRHSWSDQSDHSARRHMPDRTLRILLGSGRGCGFQGDELPPVVLFPLRGRLRLTDGERTWMLHPDRILVTEARQSLQIAGGSDALWLAFISSDNVWRQLFDTNLDASILGSALLPATHAMDRITRRAGVRLAREACRQDASGSRAIGSALWFGARLLDLQSELDAMVQRCPGRTLVQRRGVFARLQRVCRYIEASGDLDLGIRNLARVANFSPCYFARTFTFVYGQAPHAMLIEQRHKRAFQLVSETELSITEIARAAGFEDRCAFARSFKRRFGATATAVRERQI